MAAEEFGYEEGTQPAWSAAAPPTPDSTAAAPVVGPGGAAFGVFPAARSARPAPRRSPLDVGTTVLRREPAPAPPPAEMRAYDPTWKERAVERASSTLERLGFDRAGARRTAQSVLGGPQSNLPLGVGLVDIPIVPSIPFLMQEGYRGTERAMSAAQQGDYGRAAMEYLGAAAAMSPVSAAVPPVAREVGKVLGKTMATRPITAPMAQGQRGVFLGEKLFTPQERARVSTAEKLEREGVSPDDVMVQTGLVRDLDGTWAVEISDDKMRVKALDAVKKVRQSVVNRIADLEDAREIRGRIDQGMSVEDAISDYQSKIRRDVTPFSKSLADNSSDVLEIKLDNAYTSLQAPIRGLKMKDVIEHPELFGRLPKLAEMQIDFVSQRDLGPSWVAGEFDPSADAIRLRSQYMLGDPEVRGVAGHEIQHAIDFGSGKDYGISPETIKKASEHWSSQESILRSGYNAENTALYVRQLMDANPGMTAEQALDKTLEDAWHYGEGKDYARAGVTLNPETFTPYAEEGNLRSIVLNIASNVPEDQIARRAEDAAAALRDVQLKSRIAEPTEAGRQEQYMRNQGEARARLTQSRIDLTPEERLGVFPMREQTLGLDRPPESLRTIEELTGGRYGLPQDVRFGASTARSRQRGAVDLGPRPIPLSEALSDQPTTLRVLENLPGKRTTVTEQELREQMRRPEVTKAEKDVLERVLSRMEGGSISAQNLVKEVGLETAPYRLEPADSDELADYGLFNINRDTTPAPWVGREPNAQNARTTIYHSPTETSADNHFQDPRYFGHTRAFEVDGVPHVVEIQSDLVQKANTVLSPEERLRLEQGNVALDAQASIVKDLYESKNFVGYSFSDMADSLERNLPALEAANEDFRLVFGSRLKEYPVFKISGLDTADALDLAIRMLRNEHGEGNRIRAADALNRALGRFENDLEVRKAENMAKLAERGTAEAQRPMFKNWERRLIREELSRAATPQQTPEYTRLRNQAKAAVRQLKEAEEYYRSNGLSDNEIAALTMNARTDAEWFAKAAQETLRYQPTPSVVRFADADTVAKIEGWPEVNVAERDRLKYAIEAQQRSVEEAERLYETKKANGADEDTMLRVELSMGNARRTLSELRAEFDRAGGDSTGRFYKKHQGIYDRYNKEVANYLKSLGGKQVKDEYGHGWWEVPVKPQQRRTQIFSMGGAAAAGAGAAGYNAPSLVGEE